MREIQMTFPILYCSIPELNNAWVEHIVGIQANNRHLRIRPRLSPWVCRPQGVAERDCRGEGGPVRWLKKKVGGAQVAGRGLGPNLSVMLDFDVRHRGSLANARVHRQSPSSGICLARPHPLNL